MFTVSKKKKKLVKDVIFQFSCNFAWFIKNIIYKIRIWS